jgi:hypothetical protein
MGGWEWVCLCSPQVWPCTGREASWQAAQAAADRHMTIAHPTSVALAPVIEMFATRRAAATRAALQGTRGCLMTTPIPNPFQSRLVGTNTWDRVLGEAGWRCECTGDCGRPHTNSGNRCPTKHGPMRQLAVVPVNPTVSTAAASSGEPLLAMCHGCASGAKRAAGQAAAQQGPAEQPDLFCDFPGGDAA